MTPVGVGGGPFSVVLFSGGRGGGSVLAELLRLPGVRVTVIVNGYDNGLSTGALRDFIPGMLGPSDFRKNLVHHLDPDDEREGALLDFLGYRFPGDADVDALLGCLHDLEHPESLDLDHPWCRVDLLEEADRAGLGASLGRFLDYYAGNEEDFSFQDCSIANIALAGTYLARDRDFNAALSDFSEAFGFPGTLLNVSQGEPAHLVAVKESGEVLFDEADIVEVQSPSPITGIHLLDHDPSARDRQDLAQCSPTERREWFARTSRTVTMNPAAAAAVREADLIVYCAGTQHSSLLPSYLTKGLGAAVASSRARAKVFLLNIQPDHDIEGWNGAEIFDRALEVMGDPDNRHRSITHALFHRATPRPAAPELLVEQLPGSQPDGSQPDLKYDENVGDDDRDGDELPTGVRGGSSRTHCVWVGAELQNPDAPSEHDGRLTAAALSRIYRSDEDAARRVATDLGTRLTWFLDLDGTLVDSTSAHAAAFRQALGELFPPALECFDYAHHRGRATDEVLADLGVGDERVRAEITMRKRAVYRDLLARGAVPALPGADALVSWLHESGRRSVVVTSASRASACAVLEHLGLDRHVSGLVSCEDAPLSKPAPDLYRHALERYGGSIGTSVAVEDSAHGVRAAIAAGLTTVQVGPGAAEPGAHHFHDLGGLLADLARHSPDRRVQDRHGQQRHAEDEVWPASAR